MANEMNSSEFDVVREAVQQQGWFLTDKRLGEGGGGETFLCVRTETLEMVRVQASKMQELEPIQRLTSTRTFIEHLAKALDPASNYFGVFKYAKRLDGRMKREIKALTNCTHPNLVRIFAADSRDEPNWYLMEFFRKGDLNSKWSAYQGKALEVLKRVRELAEALVVVHAANIVHRDIKPENIFLGEDGRWILGDFGIAFESGGTRHTEVGVPMTKEWRPDWVVARRLEDYPPTVDIFLLAKVLYAMIAGPGMNPPASQLQEPMFNLCTLYPDVQHMDAIQQFVLEHVTVREQEMKSKDANQFVKRLDELIARFSWRPSQQQIFSFISSHSITHVPAAELWQLQNLRVLLPYGAKCLRGSIRLSQENSASVPSIAISLRNLQGTEVARHSGDLHIGPLVSKSFGHWLDFEMPIAEGVGAGWYEIGLEKMTGGLIASALVLYADVLA